MAEEAQALFGGLNKLLDRLSQADSIVASARLIWVATPSIRISDSSMATSSRGYCIRCSIAGLVSFKRGRGQTSWSCRGLGAWVIAE